MKLGFLRRNIGYKLFALVLSVMLYCVASAQQNPAFFPPAPVIGHRIQIVYAGGAAAAEHAAESVEDVAARGVDGGCGQVGECRGADMRGEGEGRVLGHGFGLVYVPFSANPVMAGGDPTGPGSGGID